MFKVFIDDQMILIESHPSIRFLEFEETTNLCSNSYVIRFLRKLSNFRHVVSFCLDVLTCS